jgi:hypothetical protein
LPAMAARTSARRDNSSTASALEKYAADDDDLGER